MGEKIIFLDNQDKQEIQEYTDTAITNLNIVNSTGVSALHQSKDAKYTGILLYDSEEPEKSKNFYAVELDETLKTEQPIGGIGDFASSFGGASSAQGKRALAEGTNTIAKGKYSHAEGDNSVTLGNDSHAEGYATTAFGTASHAEGSATVAYGHSSHASGASSIAYGDASFAHGSGAMAQGIHSAAFGNQTIVSRNNAMAIGSYNADTGAIFVIGDGNDKVRHNLFEVHDGAGDLDAGAYYNSEILATVAALNNKTTAIRDEVKSNYGRKTVSGEILEIKDLDNPHNAKISSTVTDNYFYKKNYIKTITTDTLDHAEPSSKPLRITMSYDGINEIEVSVGRNKYDDGFTQGKTAYIIFTTPNNTIMYNRLTVYWQNAISHIDTKTLKPNRQYMLIICIGGSYPDPSNTSYLVDTTFPYLVDYEDSYHWAIDNDTSNIPCPYTIMIPHVGRIDKGDTLSIQYQCSEAAGLMYEKLIQITELLEQQSEGTLDFSNII